MARPPRYNVDYFPFLCSEGETVYCIEQKYGNDGYATWIKILRQLAVTDYHYLNLSKHSSMMFLAAKCKISTDLLIEIIKDLVEFGDFDRELWEQNKIIFCAKFIDSIEDAYIKRNNKVLRKQGLLHLLLGLGVSITPQNGDKGSGNPQSKVKKNKVEESKEEKGFQAPTFFDVETFFIEKGFTSELAKRAYDYYHVANWKDSKGNQVKNWKQKMLSVWLTEKNKNQDNGTKPKLTRAQQQIQAGRENYERIIREAAARNAAGDKGFSVPNEDPTS